MNNENEKGSVDFFIGELEHISTSNDRRYKSLSDRVKNLENKNSFFKDDELGLIKPIVSMLVMYLFLQFVIPLLHEVISAWMHKKVQ